MKKGFLFWFLMCFLIPLVSEAKLISYKPNQVIVKFKQTHLTLQNFDLLLEDMQATEIHSTSLLPELKLITFKNRPIEDILNLLSQHPAVEYAEPNFVIHLFDGDDDDDDDDNEWPFPWPFPFPPPQDGKFPFPWPPGDGGGGGKPPFPWPPGDGGGGGGGGATKDPTPIAPPETLDPKEDPELSQAWGLKKIGAPQAWKKTAGSKDIIVGVIDTGVDYNHPDLSYNIYRNPNETADNKIDDDNNGFVDDVIGWDFVHKDNLPFDDHMHGTHVSGTIGAVGNNGIGVSGVNQTVTLLGVKAFDSQGSGEVATAIEAIEYAVAQGAKVLNNSWGDSEFSKALEDVIGAAGEKGVTVVCAAGNETNNNDKTPTYPATIIKDNVISVAASTDTDTLAFFSNYGKKTVHLAAPGAGIYSTVPDKKYDYLDGTSMASPHVAGAAALVLSEKPELSPKEIRKLLMDSVDKISAFANKTASGGRLNVARALEKLK